MSSDSKEPSADQAAPFDWRKHLPVHPAAEFFPLLKDTDPSGFKGLVEDIRVRGLIEPIVGWSSSEGVSVLDGRNRLDALAQLGLLHETHDHHVGIKKWTGKEWRDRRSGAGEVRIDGYEGGVFRSLYERDGLDPYALALSLNVHRRHLNAEQKRDLIAKVLKARPEASDHSIGKQTGSDDKTVTSVRRELESNSEIPNKTKRVEATGRNARGRKPGSGSSGFDAACERAKRLGLEVRRFDQGYQLTDPEYGNGSTYFTGLGKLNQQLKEIADSRSPKDTPIEPDEPQATADSDDIELGGVEEPEKVLVNVLDTIKHQKAVAEAYRKVLKASSFDRAAKQRISDEIDLLIRKWRVVQSTLAAPPDGTPTDPSGGSKPAGEPKVEEPTESEPATSTVPAVEDPLVPPIDRALDIPDYLVQAARQRHPAAGPPDTPPAPIPAPTPATPAPPPLAPRLNERTRVLPHYQPAHRDPWPSNWKKLDAAELDEAIAAVQRFGVNHRLEDRHHKQLARMRERLAVLLKADRAERPRANAEMHTS
jgi:hypothetical protein